MKPNPFKGLVKSRKVWLLIIDACTAILGLWIGALVEKELAVLIMATWGAIQPVLVAVVLMIAKEDTAKLEAASRDLETKTYAECNRENGARVSARK